MRPFVCVYVCVICRRASNLPHAWLAFQVPSSILRNGEIYIPLPDPQSPRARFFFLIRRRD